MAEAAATGDAGLLATCRGEAIAIDLLAAAMEAVVYATCRSPLNLRFEPAIWASLFKASCTC